MGGVVIAVDPLEGTNADRQGQANALAVIAVAEHGNFLHAPDIQVGPLSTTPLPDAVCSGG